MFNSNQDAGASDPIKSHECHAQYVGGTAAVRLNVPLRVGNGGRFKAGEEGGLVKDGRAGVTGGGASWPFTETLIRPRSGERCRREEQACQHPGSPSSSFYPLPSSLSASPSVPGLPAFPKSSDKLAGKEEKGGRQGCGGSCGSGQQRCVGRSPPLKP